MTTEQTADGLHMAVGRLEGRLGALEERTGRNEAEVRDKLNGMDSKLDIIQKAIAERVGFKAGSLWVIGSTIAALSAGGAWFFGFLRGHGG